MSKTYQSINKTLRNIVSGNILRCTINSEYRKKVPSSQTLKSAPFSKIMTDHCLEIDFNPVSGWGYPRISRLQELRINPSASSLHYGFQAFEGMKAYRNQKDDTISLFRPQYNMQRFKRSAQRLMFPDFDEDQLLECIKELILTDKRWVPHVFGQSLYIRPLIISTDPNISIRKPESAKIITTLYPTASYFDTSSSDSFPQISLYATDEYVRAWEGGTGEFKIGGNYAPSIMVQLEAQKRGHSQVLWLSQGKVTEAGTMNIFFIRTIEDENPQSNLELITPKLNSTILPGMTRDSIIELAKRSKRFGKISEIDYTMEELISDIQSGKVIEAFGSGTAVAIAPISSIEYKDKVYSIENKQCKLDKSVKVSNSNALSFYYDLLNIQYGLDEDPFGWVYPIE